MSSKVFDKNNPKICAVRNLNRSARLQVPKMTVSTSRPAIFQAKLDYPKLSFRNTVKDIFPDPIVRIFVIPYFPGYSKALTIFNIKVYGSADDISQISSRNDNHNTREKYRRKSGRCLIARIKFHEDLIPRRFIFEIIHFRDFKKPYFAKRRFFERICFRDFKNWYFSRIQLCESSSLAKNYRSPV